MYPSSWPSVYRCGGGSRALTTTSSRSERRPPQAGPSVLTISTLAPAPCSFIRVPYRAETVPYRIFHIVHYRDRNRSELYRKLPYGRIFHSVHYRDRNRSELYRKLPYDIVLCRMVRISYGTVTVPHFTASHPPYRTASCHTTVSYRAMPYRTETYRTISYET